MPGMGRVRLTAVIWSSPQLASPFSSTSVQGACRFLGTFSKISALVFTTGSYANYRKRISRNVYRKRLAQIAVRYYADSLLLLCTVLLLYLPQTPRANRRGLSPPARLLLRASTSFPCVHMYVYVCVCVCVCMYVYVCNTYVCVFVCVYVCVYTYTRICMYTCMLRPN